MYNLPEVVVLKSLKSFDKNFYKKAKRRKDKLVEKLLADNMSKELYKETFDVKKNQKRFIKRFAEKSEKFWGKQDIVLKKIDYKEQRVKFVKNKKTKNANRICIALFEPYCIEPKFSIYIYFEIYYGKTVICCLMKKESYDVSGKIPLLGFDVEEWKDAKLQMKMWNQLYEIKRCQIKMQSQLTDILKTYCCVPALNADRQISALEHLFSSDSMWILASYLSFIQLNSFLPYERQLRFLLNLYNAQDNLDQFANVLKKYVSKFISSKTPIKPDCIVIQQEFSQEHNYVSVAGTLILLKPSNKTIQYCCDRLNHFFAAKIADDEEYPLKQIPLIVGATKQSNGAILDIPFDAKDYIGDLLENDILQEIGDWLHHGIGQIIPMPAQGKVKKCQDKMVYVITRAENQWNEWARSAHIKFLPTEYLKLAAWLNMLLCGQIDDYDFQSKVPSNPTYLIVQKLIAIEERCIQQWHTVKSFLYNLYKGINDLKHERPDSKEALEKMTAPFVTSVDDVEVIAYSGELFKKAICEQIPSMSEKDVINALHAKKLLKINLKEQKDTLNIKMPYGKSSRFYAFVIKNLEIELKNQLQA